MLSGDELGQIKRQRGGSVISASASIGGFRQQLQVLHRLLQRSFDGSDEGEKLVLVLGNGRQSLLCIADVREEKLALGFEA